MRQSFKRRLGILSLLAAASLMAGCGGVDEEGTPRRIARQVDQALTTVAENELSTDPELASRLGLTEGAAGYAFQRRLTDRSQAAYERKRLTRLETLEGLLRTPRPAVGSAQARHLDTVIGAYEAAESLFLSGHGVTGLGTAYPYAADHVRGAYIDVPVLLTRYHPLRSVENADAYEDRLRQWAGAIDDDRRRLAADSAAGVTPPSVILDRMAERASAIRAEPSDTAPVLGTLATSLEGISTLTAGEQADRLARATRIYTDSVLPALDAFEAGLDRLSAQAPEASGIWQLPAGPRFYVAALEAIAGEPVNPSALHQQALADVAALTVQLDAALATTGLVQGSVANRLQTLASQTGQVYPPTPDGEAALVARIASHLSNVRIRLETLFVRSPEAPVELEVLSASPFEDRPIAAYHPAPANQSAPAVLVIDPARSRDWPDFTLATLTAREALPGRHLESALAAEQAQLPLARQILLHVGFSEGWAIYAETLADESGIYAIDPVSRIGYLRSMLVEAAQVVIDTGLHHQRWTRAQAILYLANAVGLDETAAARLVDHSSVSPGEVAAGWIGRRRLLDMRETSTRVLGPKFDIRAFHAAVLTGGPRPLQIVEDDIRRWYTSQID